MTVHDPPSLDLIFVFAAERLRRDMRAVITPDKPLTLWEVTETEPRAKSFGVLFTARHRALRYAEAARKAGSLFRITENVITCPDALEEFLNRM